ncbi:MAG TPA: RNA polymerase sigma factor [Gemmatimonadales bacterium]|nr:RNA polymerase sigma factor [Gemmatimonadales bacterium]
MLAAKGFRDGRPVSSTGGGGPRDDIAADGALVERVLGGDAEAFAPLVRRYLQPAYNVAYRLLSNRQDAEDLVQEAFLTALANLRSFDRSRSFGPWFYRIVWTRGLNLRKSLARRAAEPLEAERHPGAADPSADAERSDLAETVLGALAELPERQRLIVQLFDLDGFSGAEIGEMLGINPGTVRWYLHQGRRALRERLAPFQEALDEG